MGIVKGGNQFDLGCYVSDINGDIELFLDNCVRYEAVYLMEGKISDTGQINNKTAVMCDTAV